MTRLTTASARPRRAQQEELTAAPAPEPPSDPKSPPLIDQLVYKLYGLTDAEIRIVEGEARVTAVSRE